MKVKEYSEMGLRLNIKKDGTMTTNTPISFRIEKEDTEMGDSFCLLQ